MFFVDFFYGFTGAHVPAFHSIFHCIDLAISHQVLIAARIQIIRNYIGPLLSSPNRQRPNPTENIRQALLRLDIAQNPIPFLLQSRTPIHPLEIKLKINPDFPHFYLIVFLSRHVLEDGCAVDVVQFFCLVADGLDVPAFEQGYFADYLLVFLLLWGQVVMGDVAGCLEAVRKWHLLAPLQEHIKNLLITQIIKPQHNITLDNLNFLSLILPEP